MNDKLNPLVSIIISTKNRCEDLTKALNSLRLSEYKNYQIIVNDNCSTDRTSEVICSEFPEVKLIQSVIDRGAAGGKNIGVESSSGLLLLFIDSDVVVAPNMIGEMVKKISSDPTVGVVGSKVFYLNDPSCVWSMGGDINLFTSRCKHLGGFIDDGRFDSVEDVGHFATGYMIKKAVLNEVGGFYSPFFIMFEESDLQERIRAAGFRIVLCPSAHAWHNITTVSDESDPLRKIGLFSKTRAYYSGRNRPLFIHRNSSFRQKIIFFTIYFQLVNLYYAFQCIKLRRFDILKAFLKGSFDGFFKLNLNNVA